MQTMLNKSGYLTPERQAKIESVQASQAATDREILAKRLRSESGVFEKYAKADIDNVSFIQAVAPGSLGEYIAARNDLGTLLHVPCAVILRGKNGTGKTHLASGLVNAFCDRGDDARYTTAADFFLELQSTFNTPGRTKIDLVERYRRYRCLVLDEIEVRSESTWENNILRGLIDRRYASPVATVIVTNKTEQQIQEYFSPAIRDRIREQGAIVSCDGVSLRGRAGGNQ